MRDFPIKMLKIFKKKTLDGTLAEYYSKHICLLLKKQVLKK